MKKIMLGLLAMVMACTVVAAQNGQDTQKSTEVVSSQVQTGAVEFDLTAGHYVVGVDIPAGEYNLKAEENSGRVVVSSMYDNGVTIDMTTKKDDLGKKTFTNLKLAAPMVLSVTGELEVELTSKNATLQPFKKVEIVGKEVTLKPGVYTVGKDIVPGTYDVVAVSGTGNVSSSNMFEGGISEVFTANDKDYGIEKFSNLTLEKGAEFRIDDGATIKLVPSEREFIK